MRGHKLSGTRQWNRHWQSSELGDNMGGKPVPPFYPSFADFQCNVYQLNLLEMHTSGRNEMDSGGVLDHDGMLLFTDENLIFFGHASAYSYFNVYPPRPYNTFKWLLPKNFEFQLKDKLYFNSDDLYSQYPTGFHHLTMSICTINFFGEDIEFYEIGLAGDYNTYNFDEFYIEYDFARATKNNLEYYAPVQNTDGTSDENRSYFGLWHFKGAPTYIAPMQKLANVKFEDDFDPALRVMNTSYSFEYRSTMLLSPTHLFGFKSTYDLNNLYDSIGVPDLGPVSDIDFIVINGWDYDEVDIPPVDISGSIGWTSGYYTDLLYNKHYQCKYNGNDLYNLYVLAFYNPSEPYTDVSHLKMSTYY